MVAAPGQPVQRRRSRRQNQANVIRRRRGRRACAPAAPLLSQAASQTRRNRTSPCDPRGACPPSALAAERLVGAPNLSSAVLVGVSARPGRFFPGGPSARSMLRGWTVDRSARGPAAPAPRGAPGGSRRPRPGGERPPPGGSSLCGPAAYGFLSTSAGSPPRAKAGLRLVEGGPGHAERGGAPTDRMAVDPHAPHHLVLDLHQVARVEEVGGGEQRILDPLWVRGLRLPWRRSASSLGSRRRGFGSMCNYIYDAHAGECSENENSPHKFEKNILRANMARTHPRS